MLKVRYIAIIFGLLASIGFFFIYFNKASADISSNVVDTSTSVSATQTPSNRHSFYDSSNNLYWIFYDNGTDLEYSYSSNGTSWTSGGTISVGSEISNFSVWYVAGTTTVYLAYYDINSFQVSAVKGTLNSSSISWGSTTSVAAVTVQTNVYIARDSNGKLWVVYGNNTGTTRTAFAKRSTNADNTSAWDAAKTLDSGPSGTLTVFMSFSIVSMTTTGNMYFTYARNGTTGLIVKGNLWTDSGSSMGGTTTIDTFSGVTGSSVQGVLSTVPMDTDLVHLIYKACTNSSCSTGAITYNEYSSGSWGTSITIDSNTSDNYPTMTFDGTNLYAFYIRSNTIYYRLGQSPYDAGSWGAETTLVSTNTNKLLSSSYTNSNGYAILGWTEGTGSPFNVRFYGLTLAAAPTNTPTPTPTSTPTPTPTPTPFTSAVFHGGVKIQGGSKIQ